jgi:hypothetical protein
MKKTCETAECGVDFETQREHITLCQACRSARYYWKKKRPAQILFRRGRLKVFSSRLVEWFDGDGRKR